MMTDETPGSGIRVRCVYTRLPNGIHEFVMTEASRAAVDEFVAALEEMAQFLPPGKTAPILMDSTIGMQPTSYIISQTLQMIRKYPPPQENQRMAIILRPSFLLNTIAVMLRIFPFLNVRFFKPEERDEAVQWLTEPR
jgi:hypothetical protein